MATLASRAVEREEVGATGVHFVGDTLCVSLDELDNGIEIRHLIREIR